MQKGQCQQCGHTIQQTHTNRCMICGEPLPDSQQFSEEEKAALRAQREMRELERLKARQRRGGGDAGGAGGDGGGDCWGFGDCGSSDGGGDGGGD